MNADDVFSVLVAYEVAALAGRRLPTVTSLCRAHRVLTPLVLGVIAAHLLYRRPEAAVA